MDIAFDIVKRCIVRFVLLSLVQQSEKPVGIISAFKIEVDQANQNALALRESLESFLKGILCIFVVVKLSIAVGKFCEYFTLFKIFCIDAFLEIGYRAGIVLQRP